MKVLKITAFPQKIELTLDAAVQAEVQVQAFVPLVCADKQADFEPGRAVLNWKNKVNGNTVELSRYENYDLLICRFEAKIQGSTVEGIRYVTDFSEDFAAYQYTPPKLERPIGTWCNALAEDVDKMRFGYMMDELDHAWLMTLHPKADDIAHIWNGKTYYFSKEKVEEHDAMLAPLAEKGIPCLLRFINRFHYHLRDADPELFEMLRHPGYEADFPGVEMSAVNLRTEAGLNYYCACLDFLFQRYGNPEGGFGWSMMMDVGNEVNSQRIWHNAGPMECDAFMEEYTGALRLAWQLSHQYYAQYRVNISLEQNFSAIFQPEPLYYYSSWDCLMALIHYCHRDGDFDWGVAAHPYPENLSYPDFYNDRRPTFSFDTPLITMKNMEVWPALLSSPEFLYRGQARHVIFDEQGFNTREEHPYTEEQGAYAFVLAYLKMRQNPAIDMMLIHRYIDIPFNEEYGLNLGLRRCLGYADEEHLVNIPGPHKMICQAIEAMDTPQEDAWIRAARAYIGPELFDSVLNPPEIDQKKAERYITNFNV